MKFFIGLIANFLCCWLTYGAASILSPLCFSAVSDFLTATYSSSRCSSLSSVLNSSYFFDSCTISNQGVDCSNLGEIYSYADAETIAHPVVASYYLPSQSSCPLCMNDALTTNCSKVLKAITEIALGSTTTVDFGFSLETMSTLTTSLYSCQSSSDQSSIAYLAYQANLVCMQSNSFGYPVANFSALEGVFDSRSLMQCGTCAIIPCVPGLYCPQNSEVQQCPSGSYCPTTQQRVRCPRGYFCPQSSTSPIKCRSTAAGSCDKEGSTREVVWVPLFISLVIFCFFILISNDDLSPSWWLKIRGLSRPDPIAVRNRSKAGPPANKDIVYQKVRVGPTNAIETQTSNASSLRVNIIFENVKMVSGEAVRIAGVSGLIPSGKFTAILGGSGAGKTSLMNSILAREMISSGSIKFIADGVPGALPQKLLNRITGFVPQNDVLIRSMTVYQAIAHSAQTRLPPSYTEAMITDQIEHVIRELDLETIRDVIIGGDEDSFGTGLGAGDRKKVNIAVELVSCPSVLFLDEPTSSIDASSALKVAQIINSLARSSLTCVAVIHQPRGEIFDLIDNLILLLPGGKVAYEGPMKHVIGWFNRYGYELPHSKANRTDFLLDVTCGNVAKTSLQGNSEKADDVNIPWEELWKKDGEVYLSSCGIESGLHVEKSDGIEGSQLALERVTSRPAIPFLVFYYAKRAFLQRIKGKELINFVTFHLIAGIITGIITCGGPLVTLPIPGVYKSSCPAGAETLCSQWQRFQIGPSGFLVNMILAICTVPTAVNSFGREIEVLYREAAVGASVFSYWFGKLLADGSLCFIGAFFYVAPMVAIAPWRADTGNLYLPMVLLSLFVTGYGYMLSFIFRNANNATLCGALLSVVFCLFCGFVPNLGDNPQGMIFYTHYIARLVVTAELYGSGITDRDTFNSIVPAPWQDPTYNNDLGYMTIIVVLMYALSYVGIRYNIRNIKV